MSVLTASCEICKETAEGVKYNKHRGGIFDKLAYATKHDMG